ncbi:MAG: outer-membrane lipoprotein carrier protein LolA [Bacteroides sp.]|nr:outer-membrane lipoprotein carrier protein LolA [Bacteroides sp.]MCM1413312.1 outer-membrane lipoprotein carrier protein LolA [Bacteroides sp.]MCM1472002.1 outer-membrane lipoprotein carrier protein LolA [Bacteroides sp.]
MLRSIKYILPSLMVLITAFSTFAADNAASTLAKASDKLRKANSVSVAFTMTADGQAVAGRLTLSGDKFMLTTPQLAIWYDGQTQWTLSKADKEVTVDEPTEAELAQVNPLIIMQSLQKTYTAKTENSTASKTTISLKANGKNEIPSATISLNPSTLFPQSISLTLSSGKKICINITSISTGKKISPTSFKFHPEAYPDVYVNDLR